MTLDNTTVDFSFSKHAAITPRISSGGSFDTAQDFATRFDMNEIMRSFGEMEETAIEYFKCITTSQSNSSPNFRLITRLTNLFRTPADSRWPNAIWPTQDAFDDARRFLYKLPLSRIPEPEIRFASDGEINFLWSSHDVHVDLGFYGTGTYSYFGRARNGQEIQDENVLASSGLAEPIIDILAD